jgi:hypothetical protein
MMTRRMARATVAVIAAALVAGCAGKPPDFDKLEILSAEGFYLELWIHGQERYVTLYRVNGAHRIGFGGGADAFNKNISWVGTLTDDQYAELQRLLELHGWFAGTVSKNGEPPERVTRVQLQWPGGSRRFKVTGHNADIEPIRKLLDGVARQRLHRDLNRLPEAGEERYK